MDMVGQDGTFMDVPTVHPASFIEQLGEPSDELVVENLSPVFGDEGDMEEVAVDSMVVPPEYGLGHTYSLYRNGRRKIWLDPRAEARGLRLFVSMIKKLIYSA